MVTWPGKAITPEEDDDEVEKPDRFEQYLSDSVRIPNAERPGRPPAELVEQVATSDFTGERIEIEPHVTFGETVSDVVRSGPARFNDLLTSTIGLNAKVRNFVLDAVDLIPGETFLEEGFEGFVKATLIGPEKATAERALETIGIHKYEPKTAAGRVSARVGEEVFLSLPFMLTGGAAALMRPAGRGLNVASQDVKQLVKQEVLRPYVANPATTAVAELAAGTGAGLAGGVSNEVFGENLFLDMTAMIVGGVTAGGITYRMMRAGSGSRELVKLMDDATLDDGRLPGRTADQTKLDKAVVVSGALREDRMAAQAMTDDYVETYAEFSIGPLFGERENMSRFVRKLDADFPGLDPIARQGQIDYAARRLAGEQQPRVMAKASQEDYSKFIDESLDATTTAKKFIDPIKVRDALVRGVVDRSGNLSREILKAAGPMGEKAMQRFHTAKGATPYAAYRFRIAAKDIFGGLNNRRFGRARREGAANVPTIRRDFDRYLFALRGREATRLQDIKGEKPFLNVKNAKGRKVQVTDKQFAQDIVDIEARIGLEWTKQFKMRSARFFSGMADNIDRLDAEGLLKTGEAAKLRSSIYSPKQFIDDIDPVIQIHQGAAIKSVRSSGIQKMEGGGLDYVNLSSEDLMAQTFARTEGRIFRNRVAKDFARIAEELPENGMVSLTRPKRGPEAQRWVQFSAVDEGEVKKFFMHPDIVPEYLADDVQGIYYKTMSILSGTKVGKALITGANPAIVPVLFMRDMAFIIQTTGQYNRYFKPIGYGQMARDLAVVAKDVVTRTGRVEAYFREGGGMNFLTHQGRLVDETTMTGRTQEIMHVLGWFGETGELMTRLALRERALKNGFSPEDATFAARDYMDFAQGGEWVKAAESVIMYANAAMLGWRNTLRAAKKDPTAYAAGVANTMAFFGAAWWYNNQTNPDASKDMSARQKNSGLHLMTPYSRIDANQNPRHTVIKVPVDPTAVPVMILTNAIMDRIFLDEVPDAAGMESIRGAVDAMSIGSATSPTVEIYLTFKNYSTWREGEVWNGAKVEYGEEIKSFPDEPTAQFAQDMAKLTQSLPDFMSSPVESPERLAAAMKIAGGSNTYAQSFSGTYQAFRGNPEGLDTSWQQVTRYVPLANRFVRETHPLSREIEIAEQLEKVANTPIAKLKRSVDREVAMLVNGEPGRKPIKKILRDAIDVAKTDALGPPGVHVKTIELRIKEGFLIAQHYKKHEGNIPPNVPSPSQVLFLRNQPAEVQARIYAEWMKDIDADDKRAGESRRFLNKIRGITSSFTGESFQRSLKHIEDEERGVGK